MSDAIADELIASGWSTLDDDGFLGLVGPLWHRVNDVRHEYAIIAQPKHKNRRGLVQGGLVMTFADRTLGMTARFETGANSLATVQMDTHFIDATKIGEVLISKPRMVRNTKTLIFMSTEITVSGRCVAMASGVFKVLR